MKTAVKVLYEKYRNPLFLIMAVVSVEGALSLLITKTDKNISYWRSLDHIDIQFVLYMIGLYVLVPLILSTHAGFHDLDINANPIFGFSFGLLINFIFTIISIPIGFVLLVVFIRESGHMPAQDLVLFFVLVFIGMFTFMGMTAVLGGVFGWLGIMIATYISKR